MKAISVPLLWKWSVRDLRQRWMQVVGVSIIIALGVAVFSGLGSAAPWRTKSLDESYAMLNMHDVKLAFTPGSFLDAERLSQAIRSIPHADWVEEVDLRLNVSTSVNASTPDQSVLVSGQLIGVSAQPNGGPVVNRLHVTLGRALEASDAGEPVCVVEHNFATHYDLKPGDRSIQVSGGPTLEPVGNAISPEHFMVIEEESGALGIMAQERLAVLFVPLETAQEIAGLPGMVNEALITVPAGLGEEELDQLKAELEDAMAQAFPQVGLRLEKRSENRVYRILYDDIPGDQEMFDTFAFILLLGAAFGAFILIGRIVDAQRREIGINMALGVPRVRIACRYLLVSAQIALLGMALGMVLGLLINEPMGELISQMIPTPYFESPLQPEVFLRGALIGLVVPFLAVLYPIWRAVRVPPVDAIQTGYLVSKGGGLAPLLARSPLGRVSGSSFTQLPLRNLSRGLQRTLMTVLGLSMAIIVLITIVGMIDSIHETLDSGRQETQKNAPDRTLVLFDDFYPLSGDLVSDIAANSRIAQVVPGIALPGRVTGGETIDVLIQLLDLDNDLWTPTIVRGKGGSRGDGPGILLTEKAARDLGVDVGDSVTLRHLYRESQYAWRFTKTPVQVVGIHPGILRTAVYMDIRDASIMNLDGVTNGLHINPATGVEETTLRQELSRFEEVASVRRALATTEAVRDILDEF
jgi:putative ABC transport system permease protein